MQSKILKSIENLDLWIEHNGWAGYDPFDIKELSWILKITAWGQHHLLLEILRESLFEILNTFPIYSRKIFKIKPQINPKGMGLFSKAYLDLFLITNNSRYLQKSEECLNWLNTNKSKTYPGSSWGYPFDWQSNKLIPKFTPNGIVTTAVGDAFWAWYEYSKEDKHLAVCVDICRFIKSLPIDRIADDQICFSYTPIFLNHVHNLNLFVAEFLIKIGKKVGNNDWIGLGLQAVNYTLTNQMQNGAFDYNGPPEKPKNYADNFHTGFVLRMLHSIWEITDNNEIFKSMSRCYNHYINNFFENKTIPKFLPKRKYRTDIHSCAESINCLSQLSHTFPEGLEIAQNVAAWTIKNLQDKEGYFFYGFLNSRFTGRPFLSKIAYIRWGQAWMLKALSNILIKMNGFESVSIK
jgi:hypothetical protein